MCIRSTPDTRLDEILFNLGALAVIVLIALISGVIQRLFQIKVDCIFVDRYFGAVSVVAKM